MTEQNRKLLWQFCPEAKHRSDNGQEALEILLQVISCRFAGCTYARRRRH